MADNTVGINLVVCHGGEGGELFIDTGGEPWDRFVHENKGDIGWTERTLEDGMFECDEYFYDNTCDDNNEGKWQELKEQFAKQVAGLTGKFYVWGVEYDCDLMFVPEDQAEVWKNFDPDEDEEDFED